MRDRQTNSSYHTGLICSAAAALDAWLDGRVYGAHARTLARVIGGAAVVETDGAGEACYLFVRGERVSREWYW